MCYCDAQTMQTKVARFRQKSSGYKLDSQRFRQIDAPDLTAGDKLAKIRPLHDRVNASLQQFGLFEKDLSIDEQMVPYFGRQSTKMFIGQADKIRTQKLGSSFK